ncbi:MAG: hypothetical protein GY822_16890 [Deltaproteobacteria bacterium]|nr:hypothetical protein [Deltaproteobacteria bacterium]
MTLFARCSRIYAVLLLVIVVVVNNGACVSSSEKSKQESEVSRPVLEPSKKAPPEAPLLGKRPVRFLSTSEAARFLETPDGFTNALSEFDRSFRMRIKKTSTTPPFGRSSRKKRGRLATKKSKDGAVPSANSTRFYGG